MSTSNFALAGQLPEGWFVIILVVVILWFLIRRATTSTAPDRAALLQKKVTELEENQAKLRELVGRIAGAQNPPATTEEAMQVGNAFLVNAETGLIKLRAINSSLGSTLPSGNFASNLTAIVENYLIEARVHQNRKIELKAAQDTIATLKRIQSDAQSLAGMALTEGTNAHLQGIVAAQNISDKAGALVDSFAETVRKTRTDGSGIPFEALSDAVRLMLPEFLDASEVTPFFRKWGNLDAVKEGNNQARQRPPLRRQQPQSQKQKGGNNQP